MVFLEVPERGPPGPERGFRGRGDEAAGRAHRRARRAADLGRPSAKSAAEPSFVTRDLMMLVTAMPLCAHGGGLKPAVGISFSWLYPEAGRDLSPHVAQRRSKQYSVV